MKISKKIFFTTVEPVKCFVDGILLVYARLVQIGDANPERLVQNPQRAQSHLDHRVILQAKWGDIQDVHYWVDDIVPRSQVVFYALMIGQLELVPKQSFLI